jgi:hypothetical protein
MSAFAKVAKCKLKPTTADPLVWEPATLHTR